MFRRPNAPLACVVLLILALMCAGASVQAAGPTGPLSRGTLHSDPECTTSAGHALCVATHAGGAVRQINPLPGPGDDAGRWDPAPGGAVLGGPAIAVDNLSHAYYFGRGTDGHLWYEIYTPEDGWAGWHQLDQLIASDPDCVPVYSSDTYIKCAAISTTGSLALITFSVSTHTSTVADWGGGPFAYSPSIILSGSDVAVFAVRADNGMMQQSGVPGIWRDIGGVSAAPDCLDGTTCFVRGTDQSVGYVYYSYSSWHAVWLGGPSIGGPAGVAVPGGMRVYATLDDNRLWGRTMLAFPDQWSPWYRADANYWEALLPYLARQ